MEGADLEHILGKDWIIQSAGGATGTAYYAQSGVKRLFLKRNSSPFLAVLSAQGFVPKLVWTKRLENGDVVTAQEWLDGKALNVEEMQHPKVAHLLSSIHHSTELLDMLLRIEKQTITPVDTLFHVKHLVDKTNSLKHHLIIHKTLQYLKTRLHEIQYDRLVVCHCDLNHHNWMLSNHGELYLIDWDNARVGDPAMDIGRILQSYIPKEDWGHWLTNYGIEKSQYLMKRMHWHLLVDELVNFVYYLRNGLEKSANDHLNEIIQLHQQIEEWNL